MIFSFTDETEVKRGEVTCIKSHRRQVTKPGLETRQLAPYPHNSQIDLRLRECRKRLQHSDSVTGSRLKHEFVCFQTFIFLLHHNCLTSNRRVL